MAENKLYYGDNLKVLREHIKDESVDLIYLDPPFKSNQDYNVLFQEQNGSRSKAQIKAFEDTWRWDREAAEAYQQVVEAGGRVSRVMQGFRVFLGDNDMLAYLAMMAPRLVELKRVLKPTGSIYLHCDPTASAHLRLVMDAVFGASGFRNEIIWQRTRVAKRQSKFFGKAHDVVLLYTKTTSAVFNDQFIAHPESYKKSHYNLVESETGRRYGLWDFTQKGEGPPRRFGDKVLSPPPGKHWIWSQERIDQAIEESRIVFTRTGTPRLKRYLYTSKGEYVQDIWTGIFDINAVARERLGYPTQKPEALLQRIINASSNEGHLVLDPFCGCGTTIAVAQRLKRRWIGIDITHLAVSLIKHRLHDAFGDAIQYDVLGEPEALPDAEALAKQDPYQFQWWALGLVEARPVEQKKGADKGIDGRLYFHDEIAGGKTKHIVLQVKAGHVGVAYVRDLRGVLDRETAEIGVLITLQEPTQPMRTEAASAGFYDSPGWGKRYPRLQILTVSELLQGKRIDYPPSREVNVTFKKAPRAKAESTKQNQQPELPNLQ